MANDFRLGARTMSEMKSLKRAFTEHPASVDETYGEHLATSWSFAFRMLGGGLACLLHGVLPFLFKSTASGAIRSLHDRMSSHRRASR